jgi:LmbE family N-acetylglucosaminyl deacetylase
MDVGGLAGLEVWLYEVWSPVPANRVVDIAPTIATKARAINRHASQMEEKDYVKLAVRLARMRAADYGFPKDSFIEAFYVCNAAELPQLERSLAL